MIVVFGSLNMDMVMALETLPHPGETVLCKDYQTMPGGKGVNQAIAAARAGSEVKFFGAVGNDPFGQTLLSNLSQHNIDLSGVKRVESPTGCAFVCVDALGESMISVANGANRYAREQEIPQSLLGPQTIVVTQMETPLEEGLALLKRAHQAGAKTILNFAPAQRISPDALQYVSVMVLNQIESTILALHLGFDIISPAIVAQRVAAEYDITCIVTLGSAGALACTPKGVWSVDALTIKPLDTTASGDAFVGVLAASLDQEKEMLHALRRASVAGSLTCLTRGPVIGFVDEEALKASLSKLPLPQKRT